MALRLNGPRAKKECNMRFVSFAAIALIAAAGAFWLSRAPDPSAAAASADGALVAVTLPDLSAQGRAGQQAFGQFCASCHGAEAGGRDGSEGSGPPLIHKIYEPGHHGDMAFVMAARNGVRAHHWRFGDMAPVEGVSDDALRDIIAFVREVQRANGIH